MQIFGKSEKSKAKQVEPEKIGVTVIKDDEDQYFERIDTPKSKLADSVTVEKAPVMIPQLKERGTDLFPVIMIPLQIVILVLYGFYGEYQSASELDVGRYPYYQVKVFGIVKRSYSNDSRSVYFLYRTFMS